MGECFNCTDPASGTYTLALGTGVVLRDRTLCRACHDFFSASDRIEVLEAPVLVRGREESEE